jgi:hypothetical protein
MMQTLLHETPITLLDVVTTVSGLTESKEEAAVVINHMLCSERIAFANRLRRGDVDSWLS